MADTTTTFTASDEAAMRRGLDLAARGTGRVEPNPQVGAVIATPDGRTFIAEGWHDRFGGPHAEIVALQAAGAAARGATLYVTLEPCCHHGKTPPCTDAVIAAGIARVIVATDDPNPVVSGRGIAALRTAGITVETGLCAAEARRLTAPFRTLTMHGRPWVIAKWAMSLDGRVATTAGQERWISSPESRTLVHGIRERMDAIVVGIGTALADDPLLTARPAHGRPPLRTPLRLVLDSRARLPLGSALVRSAGDAPVIIAAGPAAEAARVAALRDAGCEVWQGDEADHTARWRAVLGELGRRRLTNLLVEGGPTVLASAFAAGDVDEVWAFIAPRVLGGHAAGGSATFPAIPAGLGHIDVEEVSRPGGDVLVRGLVSRRD